MEIMTTNPLTLTDMLIDEIGTLRSVSDVQSLMAMWPSNWLSGCSREMEGRVRRRFDRLKRELSLSMQDEDFREAYSFIPLPVKKSLIGFFDSILQTKRTRKRRSLKVSTKKLRFCPTGDAEFKALPFLTSPDKIIGASAVLVWIPKRKMAVWIAAKDSNGLAIVGNRIVRFDPDTSFAKTVRKPDELVQILTESKKKVFQYLKSVKTTEYEIDGKMNKKYVIVKVW